MNCIVCLDILTHRFGAPVFRLKNRAFFGYRKEVDFWAYFLLNQITRSAKDDFKRMELAETTFSFYRKEVRLFACNLNLSFESSCYEGHN